jgi:hypothetical protein
MKNEEIVLDFLAAYERHDFRGMAIHLDEKVVFSDLAFRRLAGDDVRAMWAWFCEPSETRDNQPVNIRNIQITRTQGEHVQARYEVDYTLTETTKPRRSIRYVIQSDFTLGGRRIVSQRDTPTISQFAFARMALGFPGCLLGLTPLFKLLLRKKMCKKLLEYRQSSVAWGPDVTKRAGHG